MLRGLKAWLFGKPSGPHIPAGVRIYAVGDIHGRLDLLDQLLTRTEEDLHHHPVREVIYIFLGDYVDRGPKSGHVLSRLIEHSHDYPTVCLRGNHENYLLEFLEDPHGLEEWARLGALPTLSSYGLSPQLRPTMEQSVELSAALNEVIPDAHRRFLSSLRPCFEYGDYFFVHAGVRPGIALAAQSEEDLLYIREEFLFHEGAFEKFIVHGHTPVKQPDRRFNRINIDTGAYATGRLTCLCIEAGEMRFV